MTSPYLVSAPLRSGDVVRLIAPSGPTDEASLDRAVEALESWGLHVRLGKNIRARHPHVKYLAGTDDQRRTDLVDAWCDPEAAAVVAVRGGYGAMRLLDGLDFTRLARHSRRPDGRPKLLAGSSDITALHQAWEHHLGVPTLFCPMPGNDVFRDSARIPAEVKSWLFSPWDGRQLGFAEVRRCTSGVSVPDAPAVAPAVTAAPRTLVPGHATGRLTGGNLSLIAAAMGSPEMNGLLAERTRTGAQPVIGVLEDVDEEAYRVDNLLLQLVRGGWFAGLAGLVLGSWHKCAPVAEVEALVLDHLGEAGIPIVSELGFGHDPDAPSTPLGLRVRLEAPADGLPGLSLGTEPNPAAAA